jgi:hypothetical protein
MQSSTMQMKETCRLAKKVPYIYEEEIDGDAGAFGQIYAGVAVTPPIPNEDIVEMRA